LFHRPGWISGIRAAASARSLSDLDPRWLDAAVDAGQWLVCALARPGHAAANRLLSDELARVKDPQHLLRTMVRIRHPEAIDALIAALKEQAKEKYHHYYVGYWYGPMIADLPRSALAQIEEVLPTLPDKMVDQLMEHVLALKGKPE
jgi:hypothetical protein